MKKLYLQFLALLCTTFVCAQTPVASYFFNGNANDASGTANGTVNGATLTTDRFGNANSAYNFDGINNFIEAAADALPTGDNTISLWFNADAGSVATRPGLLGYGGNAGGTCPGNSQILIINLTGQAKYTTQAHCLNNYADYAYAAPPENNWYNWVVTRNGATIKMYINGLLVSTAATATQPVIVSGKKLSIGAVVGPNGVANYTDPNVGHFKGKIDDIKIYNTALTDKQVSDNYLAESLAASYSFNGNANDASGNGNNGIVNGATLTADRFGNANSAYSFNGASSYIDVANSPTLQLSNSYTLSAWVKPNAFYNGACQANFILAKGNQASEGHYNLQYGDFLDGSCGTFTPANENFASTIKKGGADQSAYENPSTQPVALNNWYYVVCTYDGTTLKLFVNGKLRASNTTSGSFGVLNTQNLFIGKSNDASGYFVNGIIDDVKIYNTPLTEQNIFDTYVNDLRKPGSGNGLQLNRTNSLTTDPWVNIGSGYDFGTQPFTYETWVKRDDLHTTQNNFGIILIVSDLDNGWGVGIDNSNTLFFTKVGINGAFSTGTIADTKWHHVAVVYTGTQIQFYIDGVAAGVSAYTDNFTVGGNYIIGARQSFGNSNGDQTINGMFDETRIWRNVALTQTQIRDWMCKKVTSSHPAYTNLFAYFRFDDNSGPAINGFNSKFGTFNNSPLLQTSGASLGDAAAHDFVNATKTANISHASGENFSVTSTSGAPSGIVVYRVDEQPNTLSGASGVGQNDKYFGVFQAGGTSPQYSAVYNYSGNPFVTPVIEPDLRLNKRTDNSSTTWTVMPDVANEPANTITVTGQSTEYILGRQNGVLPVNLVAFNAEKNNAAVLLNWNTENEINLQRYEVERSSDGRVFVKINEAAAKSNSINTYNIVDGKPLNGLNYYRLKIINKDGTYRYSIILKVDFSKKYLVSILPNPAHDYIIINGADKFKRVQLVDMTGKLVKQFIVNSGNRYNITGIPQGVYLLQLINDDEQYAEKIIIQ
jgi:Concanavalin A-like lectin/glucanases superfamily/Secretion system C-terminal sorting domain